MYVSNITQEMTRKYGAIVNGYGSKLILARYRYDYAIEFVRRAAGGAPDSSGTERRVSSVFHGAVTGFIRVFHVGVF
jgi:hypothetical protein